MTLPKLYATEPFIGTQAARRLTEPVRQVSYEMLSRRIGGPNDACGLEHYGVYSYYEYTGPKSLSQDRDSHHGVAVHLMQSCLSRGEALGVPSST